MEKGFGRERTRKEVYCWSRGSGVKTLEPLESGAAVEAEDFEVTLGEAEGG